MQAFLALIVVFGTVYLFVSVLVSCFAYTEGRDAARRKRYQSWPRYETYNNDFWMPYAYFYDRGYNDHEDKEYVSNSEKNEKRFNRK